MTRLLPLLLLVACDDVRTQKDDDLTRVCIAYDHLRIVARADTMTGQAADQQLQADLVCESAAIPDPHK